MSARQPVVRPLVAIVTIVSACGGANATAGNGAQSDAAPGEAGVVEAGDAASVEAGDASHVEAGDEGGGAICTLTENTTPTATVTGGCALVTRDTSACQATRAAAGMTGLWAKFSCRVTLTASGGTVTLASDGRPDHESNYFPTTDACYAAYSPAALDPNHIATHALAITVPLAPTTASQSMGFGAVGMAIDGTAIFDNQAAPGDDIYAEAASFDRCQGHPSPASQYHYHTEPYGISHDDDALIGVLRDGYPLYGRRDVDGSTPTNLDASGGHLGTTPDSPSTAVYHHHVNLQTSHAGASSGQTAWFLSTGTYAGPPGSCSGC